MRDNATTRRRQPAIFALMSNAPTFRLFLPARQKRTRAAACKWKRARADEFDGAGQLFATWQARRVPASKGECIVQSSEAPYMKFTITLEPGEDGFWVAECPAVPGCVSQGTTREEAIDNITEAIAACLEVRAETGLPLTVETRQIEVTI
jgi:predicted RNase H-like HicB family nuclease